MNDRSPPSARSTAFNGRRPAHGDRELLRRVIQQRGLIGLANDTKWDELLAEVRGRTGWRPSYRWKSIVTGDVSQWDVEWCYHLPFPMMSIEWLDLRTIENRHSEILPGGREVIDHGMEMTRTAHRIGFDMMAGRELLRIFGYGPRDLKEFDTP